MMFQCPKQFWRRRLSLSTLTLIILILLIFLLIKKISQDPFLFHSPPSKQEETTKKSIVINHPAPPSVHRSDEAVQSLYFVNRSFYDGIALFVENRPSPKIAYHIFNVFEHIPVTWPVQIFYGEENANYLKNQINLQPYIASGRIILTRLYDESLFGLPNELYTAIRFWGEVRGEKILTFQLDSVFCTGSPHKFSDFLHYDYIGAPWYWKNNHGSVGNSGLSLRSRKKTIELLSKHRFTPYRGKNEDQWFGANFHLVNASLPTPQIAATFSVESLYYEKPLGIHMPGIYLKEPDYQALCKQCPETRMVWPYCQEPHPVDRD